ncbi:hypothetical protein SLE2022_012830 [Rubroshorea leprosula]
MDLWAFVAREDNLLQGVRWTSITGTVFPFTQKRRIRLQSLHTPSESFARGARKVGSYHWTVHFPTSRGAWPWSWECQWGGVASFIHLLTLTSTAHLQSHFSNYPEVEVWNMKFL